MLSLWWSRLSDMRRIRCRRRPLRCVRGHRGDRWWISPL